MLFIKTAETQLLLSSVPCDSVTPSLSFQWKPKQLDLSRISGLETDVAAIKRTCWWTSGRALNPDPARASDRNLLPHLVCQLGISFRQHRLQVLKLFQRTRSAWRQVYFLTGSGKGLKKKESKIGIERKVLGNWGGLKLSTNMNILKTDERTILLPEKHLRKSESWELNSEQLPHTSSL